jgi:hypothetical protein
VRRRHTARTAAAAAVAGSVVLVGAVPALAATPDEVRGSLDATTGISSVQIEGDPSAVAVGSDPISGFPTAGGDYLVLSTGPASGVRGTPENQSSTDLEQALGGVDGNDLTRVTLNLAPPAGATCFGFDVAFLSEEYPEFVNQGFNDTFTAELNESSFTLADGQVVAPNNFAFDTEGNALSIDTVFGMSDASGTAMDGSTPALSAVSPVELREDGTMAAILSIQDLGDSIYDSAVLVDNFRWLYGSNCTAGTSPITDTDGDGLSDRWETEGIDYDNDGQPEVDLPAMGADPQHKDMFLEVDWMERDPSCIWFICWGGRTFAPQQAALDDVRAAFAAAPVSNPDGTTGIRMHIDSGAGSVMNPVTGATWGGQSRANRVPYDQSLGSFSGDDYAWNEFQGVKGGHFDTFRNDAFHYVVYADTYAGSGSSGISRGIPGADFLVTDGDEGWNNGSGFTRTQERGTFMHELGHNLSLRHGGDTDANYRTGYRSIMSYAYQLVGLPPGSRLDYSRGTPFDDWANIRFDGGSIGSLGDSAPPIETTPDDEIDHETALEDNVVSPPGDGSATFLGPTLLVTAAPDQTLQFDVTNASEVAAVYTLRLTSGSLGLDASETISLEGQETGRLEISVPEGLPVGKHTISAVVSSSLAGADLFSLTSTIDVVDGSDPAVQQEAGDALDQLDGLGANSGLDPAVLEGLRTTLTAVAEQAPPPAEPTDPQEPAGPGGSAGPGTTDPIPASQQPAGLKPDGSLGVTAVSKEAFGGLAYTGVEVARMVGLGAGVLALGTGLVLVARRRGTRI